MISLLLLTHLGVAWDYLTTFWGGGAPILWGGYLHVFLSVDTYMYPDVS